MMGDDGTRSSVVSFAPLRMVDDLFCVCFNGFRSMSLSSQWTRSIRVQFVAF